MAAPAIPKGDLVHGRYYVGHCRNARVARWDAASERFYYWREKAGAVYLARLHHAADRRGLDYFEPYDEAFEHQVRAIPLDPDARDDG